MSSTASGGKLVDAQKWQSGTKAVAAMSDAYRAAAASSGLLTASQIKSRPEVEKNIELLQKQKLSLKDVFDGNMRLKNSMRELYREQVRLQKMTVTTRGVDKYGRTISDVTVPNTVPLEDLNKFNNKLGFARNLANSIGTQMINWGKNTQWAGRQLTVGLTYPMALFAAGTAKMAYDVDKQLTRIAKVYDSQLGPEALSIDRATESMELRAKSYEFAKEMAERYGAAATDVLDVEAQFAAQGKSGQALFDTSRSTVKIATLGELDFNQATQMTYALQNAFRDTIKTGEDLERTFDMFNAVENSTSLQIQDIAEAVPRAATALAGLGADIDQTTVLLTSMSEAAIPAAEGANALKSLSARLINPGVLKQAQPFFDGILDLTNISARNGGNIYDIMLDIGKATQEMDNYTRQQGLSKLFGAWQFNRGNAIIKNLTDAMYGVGDAADNMTARAIKATKMTKEELAAISEGEIEAMANSISGKFDRAWQSLKITASEIGAAFLPSFTKVISWADTLLTTIKNITGALPDFAKRFLGVGAVLTALAGPAIMMVGLFGNLMGYGTRLIAKFLMLGGKMSIATRQQTAAALVADQAASAYTREAAAVSLLTDELRAMAAAQGYSTGVAAAVLGAPGRAGGVGAAAPVLPAGVTSSKDAAGRTIYYKDGKRVAGDSIPQVKAWKDEQKAIQRSTEAAVRNLDKAGDASKDIADSSKKTSKSWDATRSSSGLFSVALLSTMIPGAEKFSSYLITGATALMAASAVTDISKGIKAARAQKAAAKAAERSALGSQAATAAAVTSAGKVKSILAGAWKWITRLGKGAGPIGWVVGGLAAAGTFLYKKSGESAKQQEAINDSTKAWADLLGGVAEKYKTISSIQEGIASDGTSAKEIAEKMADSGNFDEIISRMRGAAGGNENSDKPLLNRVFEDGLISAFDNSKPEFNAEVDAMAMNEYIKLIDKTSLSAEDAKVAIEAMFLNAGFSAGFASKQAEHYFRTIGREVSDANYAEVWQRQLNGLVGGGGNFDKIVEGMTNELSDSMAKAEDGMVRGNMLNNFAETIKTNINSAYAESLDDGSRAIIDGAINYSRKNISEILAMWEEVRAGKRSESGFLNLLGIDPNNTDLVTQLENSLTTLRWDSGASMYLDAEQEVVRILQEQYGIKLDMLTLDNLMAKLANDGYAATVQQAQAAFDAQIALKQQFGSLNPFSDQFLVAQDLTEEQQLQLLNVKRVALGIGETTRLSDGFKRNTEGVREAMAQTARSANEIAKSLRRARMKVFNNFMNGGANDAYKDVLGNVNSAVASEAMETLESAQNASMDALEASFDRESDMFDRRADYWSEFYDNAIERTENFYDGRIERINKEIDAEEKANDIRQRIFDAEQTRLQRMAQMKNANIDFNMALAEGRLDEAAKMLNDAQAEDAKNQMEDEQKKADMEVEARRESLEKQIDLLEKQRDKKIQALEDARDAKDKAIQIAKERADKENEIDRKALEERHANQKKYYQLALNELNSYIPTSAEDLQNHIEDLNKRYSKYGVKLEAQASDWATFIGDNMNREMALAANRLRSDVNWAGAGFDAASEMMKGMAAAMGFTNENDFRKWLGVNKAIVPKFKSTRQPNNDGFGPQESFHTGGEIGRGTGGRTGFTGGQSSHNEKTVNAQVGEFMMSKKATEKYGVDFMNSVNDGRYGIGGPSAAAALMGPSIIKSIISGMYGSLEDKVSELKGAKGRIERGRRGPGRGYVAGPGGRHRPVKGGYLTQGLHPNNAIDIGIGVGSPLYAVADGVVTRSYDIPGFEPRASHGGLGYKSYGRVIAINHGAFSTLNAHLSSRAVSAGQKVRGGSIIGRTGNTGNSTGPHLHFEAHGASPMAFLRSGGELKWDNTPTMLHGGETVLTKPLTQKFKDAVAGNGNSESNHVTIDLRGAFIHEDVDIERAMDAWWSKKGKKTGRGRTIN